jgi:hypothetical protein
MLLSGALLALSILLLLWKLPSLHTKALDHPALSDVTITLAVVALGLISLTFSGLMVGIIGGILLSGYFSVAPKLRNIRRERDITPRRLQRADARCVNRTSARKPRFEDLQSLQEMEDYLSTKTTKPLTHAQVIAIITGDNK